MKRSFIIGTVVMAAGIFAYSHTKFNLATTGWFADLAPSRVEEPKPMKTMRPFASEVALKEHLKKVEAERRKVAIMNQGPASNAAGLAEPSAAPSTATKSASADSKPAKGEESITNTQMAGVDEGGIVKVHGDHLVILRRGRLFTVRIGDNSLRPAASVNAYPPGINPSNDWYDEMLVSDNTVVVIGYSYGRGGTEINLFDIDSRGDLSYRSTYHLRSNDYYSSRNYASRLIGDKLVFYTPQYLGYGDATQQFPALRKWHRGAKSGEFKSVVSATNVFRPERPEGRDSTSALHTVTVCDLSSRDMSCKGTAVLGSPGRVFYVSQKSVYVWTTDWNYSGGKASTDSMLFKMPLDGSAPSALGVEGSPVDQFSFLESDGEQLNVLVRSEGRGDQMWGGERSAGDVGLLRVRAERFSDGSESTRSSNYRTMPKPEGYTFQNRFVGDYMLYGTGNGWGARKKLDGANLFAVNWKNGEVSKLHLDHSVDRIEQLGNAAVVVGTNSADLYFSPIKLGDDPIVRPSYIRKKASQGELRSHGFFYKPDSNESGLLGLPIARQGRAGYRHLVEDSAAILFLKNNGLEFDQVGELETKNASTNDGCRASCVDWYGNARPIFLKGRIFALLGYELVEGSLNDGVLKEKRRINYSPRFRPDDRTDEEEE